MFTCNNAKLVKITFVFITYTMAIILVFTQRTSLKEMLYNYGKESRGRNFNTSVCNIGILIPSTTRNMKISSLNNLSLITTCLPSIYKFMELNYSYIIYVGIDKSDYLETMKGNLEAMFDRIRVVISYSGSFTKTANAIAREAYKDGMDYLVRINDDTSFETIDWTSQGIQALRSFSPPNVGVVGPTCTQGNMAILTHDMVHRTHLEIFDFYYPPYFDNWWADDWITRVYQPNRSTKLKSWVVKHHLSYHNTRYKVDFKQHFRLNTTLTFDKERLSHYLSYRIVNNNHTRVTV